MPTLRNANIRSQGVNSVALAAPKATIVVAHADPTVAQSATELRRPLSISSDNPSAIKIGPGVRSFALRARYNAATTAVSTSPIVRVYALEEGAVNASTGALVDTGADGAKFWRLDSNTAGAAGQTLTCTYASDIYDTAFFYSPWTVFTTNFSELGDIAGAGYLLVAVETAAVVTGTGAAMVIEAILA
jgi:hypothetical protein